MTTFPPSSPHFELRHSTVDIPVPKYMPVDHFCKTYRAAICEIEILLDINGQQFVDLESSQAKLIMLRARFS